MVLIGTSAALRLRIEAGGVSRSGRAPEIRGRARPGTRRERRAPWRASAPAAARRGSLWFSRGCGGAASGAQRNRRIVHFHEHRARRSPSSPSRDAARRHLDALPAAVQLPAVAPGPGGALSIGGLDASDSSVASVVLIDGSGAREVARLAARAARRRRRRRSTGRPTCSAAASRAARATRSFASAHRACSASGSFPSEPPTSPRRRSGARHTSSAATPCRRRCARSSRSRRRRRARRRDAPAPAALRRGGGRRRSRADRRAAPRARPRERAILSFDPATRRGAPDRRAARPPSPTRPAPSLNGAFYVLGGRGESLLRAALVDPGDRSAQRRRPPGRTPARSALGHRRHLARRASARGRRPQQRRRGLGRALTLLPSADEAHAARGAWPRSCSRSRPSRLAGCGGSAAAPSATREALQAPGHTAAAGSGVEVPRAGRIPPPLSATNVYAADRPGLLSPVVRARPGARLRARTASRTRST